MQPGTRLGPYEIVSRVGAGGMGEVYRARDTRLDRTVAIKILPPELANDPQLKIRFQREAKIISQLDHPHICALHDVGEGYLVMEYLEGETLADRLARGPLPLADVLRYGMQIAEALDRGHRSGVVHRDLKPGNLMLTKSGAKLLDFGLAKSAAIELSPDAATVQKPLTAKGTILGTFAYMAPEQLEALEADPRSDIFALGAVLYEMTTGKRAFEGTSKASLIASIVSGTPAPVRELQPLTPPALEHVITKCLAKDPEERWQSARDVAEELRWAVEMPLQSASPTSPRHSIAWVAFLLAVVAIAAALIWRPRGSERPVIESELTLFAEAGPPSLSPDGKTIAFVRAENPGQNTIWFRHLAGSKQIPLLNARADRYAAVLGGPLWSTDSRSLLFVGDHQLKKVSIDSGSVETIAPLESEAGAAMNGDGLALFATGDGIVRLSGGRLSAVTRVDRSAGEAWHRFPSFLPDGKRFVCLVRKRDDLSVYLASLSDGLLKPLVACDSHAVYAAGHVLCVKNGDLLAFPFDEAKESVGEPAVLATPVHYLPNGRGYFSVSMNGILTYWTSARFGWGGPSQLVWFNRRGEREGTLGAPANYFDPALSHDGTRLVVRRGTGAAGWAGRLVVFDLTRNVETEVTGGNEDVGSPVWSAGDERLYFVAGPLGEMEKLDVYSAPSRGGTRALLVPNAGRRQYVTDVSRDERELLLTIATDMTAIARVRLPGRRGEPLGELGAPRLSAKFSPDGKWIAYCEITNGRSEIFIASFPDMRAPTRVSTNGGETPLWSRDGRKLYFFDLAGAIAEADVRLGEVVTVAPPRVLFTTGIKESENCQFAVTADGERFLVNLPTGDERPRLVLLQNWISRLK